MANPDRGKLREIAARFGVQFLEAVGPPHSLLAKVFILDDAYVLRGRAKTPGLKERIRGEQALLAEVSVRTALQFPHLRKTEKGSYVLEDGNTFWTLYPLIHGRILGTWQELSKAKDEETELVCETMRSMHEQTRGQLSHFSSIAPRIAEDLGRKLPSCRHFLSRHVAERLEHAIARTGEECARLPLSRRSFVHGDFHHGNAIVDPRGRMVGLIDTDWCRVGHPFEDLSYFVMMFLRSYDREAFGFEEERYRKALFWYGVQGEEESLFAEFLLGICFFDLALFAKQPQSKEHNFTLQYQITMLRDLAERFPVKHLSDTVPPAPRASDPFPKDVSPKARDLAAALHISPSNIHEVVTKGGGHGGQRVNKRATCVELTHRETGISVRVQKHRELGRNRRAAYELLLKKIVEKRKEKERAARKERHRRRAARAKRRGSTKEKVLKEKKRRGELKRSRRKRISEA